MKHYIISFIWILVININSTLDAQDYEIKDIDIHLSQEFDKMMDASSEERYNNLAPKFKADLKNSLSKTNRIQFDSLSTRIKIISSKDKKLRCFSWDERQEGTWYSISVVIQYIRSNDSIQIKEPRDFFSDAVIYEIHEVEINGKVHYLTFGWGCHGSGHHHKIVQIFTEEANGLINCKNIFENNENLIIEAPRGNIALKFNPDNQEIIHDEFLLNEDIGFYEKTGKTIIWKLVKGRFIKK